MKSVELDLRTIQPKQAEFFNARTRYVGYGGARGGGKSWALRMKAAELAFMYPGIEILIIRRTLSELEANHIKPLKKLLEGAYHWNDRYKTMSFENGSEIVFGYCESPGDTRRYQGHQYDIIGLDEATQLTEDMWNDFKACNRAVNNYPKRIYVTCNPGGVGHEWVKRLFVDRRYREGERAEDYTFIQSLVYDNKPLLEADPDYLRVLESLPYEKREAWLYGKWDVFSGQYFSEWDREVHICKPFEVPEWWKRIVVLDYGLDMLAAYLVALDTQGRAYFMREVYEGRDLGDGHDGLAVWEAAERVKEMCAGEKIYRYLAPPDLFARSAESKRSQADIFADHGIYLEKANNDRIAGWMSVHERLRVFEDEQGEKTAMLRIFPLCVNLIRTLPQLQYDERRVNDVSDSNHELTHGPDAVRYFCAEYADWSTEPKEAPKKKWIEEYREQVRKARRRR